jgi:hypothetical protein
MARFRIEAEAVARLQHPNIELYHFCQVLPGQMAITRTCPVLRMRTRLGHPCPHRRSGPARRDRARSISIGCDGSYPKRPQTSPPASI